MPTERVAESTTDSVRASGEDADCRAGMTNGGEASVAGPSPLALVAKTRK